MKVDMRVGTVIAALPFPEARKPSIKLKIDLGDDIGVKQSSAQLTKRYEPEDLLGIQVVTVVNFPSMRFEVFKSKVLLLGAMPREENAVLVSTDDKVPI